MPTKAPQTLTFLVVASNIDYEIQLHIINYSLFDLGPDSFLPVRPPSWPGEPTHQPPFVPPSCSAQQMRLNRASINCSAAGNRMVSRFTDGISTSRTPRPLSNWLEADTVETEQEARGWSNNGMAPWPRRSTFLGIRMPTTRCQRPSAAGPQTFHWTLPRLANERLS